MLSNIANSLSFIVACKIFNFLVYYVNGVTVSLSKKNLINKLTEDNGPFILIKTLDLLKIMIESVSVFRLHNAVEIA